MLCGSQINVLCGIVFAKFYTFYKRCVSRDAAFPFHHIDTTQLYASAKLVQRINIIQKYSPNHPKFPSFYYYRLLSVELRCCHTSYACSPLQSFVHTFNVSVTATVSRFVYTLNAHSQNIYTRYMSDPNQRTHKITLLTNLTLYKPTHITKVIIIIITIITILQVCLIYYIAPSFTFNLFAITITSTQQAGPFPKFIIYTQIIALRHDCVHTKTNPRPTQNNTATSYSKSVQHTPDNTNVYSENQQSETSIYIKPTKTTIKHKIKYILHNRIIRRFEEFARFVLIFNLCNRTIDFAIIC